MKQRKDIGDTLFGVKDRDIIMAFLRAEEELALLKIRESVSKDASKALYKNISDIELQFKLGSFFLHFFICHVPIVADFQALWVKGL